MGIIISCFVGCGREYFKNTYGNKIKIFALPVAGLVTGSHFLGCTALRCRENLRKCQDKSSSHFLRFCYAASG